MLHLELILTLLAVGYVHGLPVEGAAQIVPRQQSSNAKPVMDRLHAQYSEYTRAALSSSGGTCTAENIAVMKEWQVSVMNGYKTLADTDQYLQGKIVRISKVWIHLRHAMSQQHARQVTTRAQCGCEK